MKTKYFLPDILPSLHDMLIWNRNTGYWFNIFPKKPYYPLDNSIQMLTIEMLIRFIVVAAYQR